MGIFQFKTTGSGVVTNTGTTSAIATSGQHLYYDGTSIVSRTAKNDYYNYFLQARRRYLLEINKIYLLSYAPNKIRRAKFISSTPRGFNFVDIETERLIFKKHIYRCRNQEYKGYTAQQSKDDFWVWMDGKVNVALPLEEQVIDD